VAVAEQRNRYLTPQESSDLGFGSVVSNQPTLRLLNRDGSFNVVKPKPRWLLRVSGYHRLLTMSWPAFFAMVLLFYVGINLVFAGAYYLLGSDALQGNIQTSAFLRDFFFSIHSFATIGYGNIVPVGVMANLVVAFEALVGLLGFALAAGMVFARFSRPVADIVFSRNAIVAPYHGITGFEFRVVNARENQLIELHAKVIFSRFESVDGRVQRLFTPLSLERESVSFFPLNWTVVHPIDEDSPLFGWTPERLVDESAEFLILLTAIDETFAQTVHSRSSYAASEVLWNARFAPMYRNVGGAMELDLSRLHSVTPAGSQAATAD
jgi:inward rectifier potassium channel